MKPPIETLDALAERLRAIGAAHFTVTPLKSGGWTANFRLDEGWTSYTGDDDEPLGDVVSRLLPAVSEKPTDSIDIFG